MAKSHRSPQNSRPPQHAAPGSQSTGSDTEHDNSASEHPAEDACADPHPQTPPGETREQRLRRIRQDVLDGKYDSDELLEQALEIMVKRMSADTE